MSTSLDIIQASQESCLFLKCQQQPEGTARAFLGRCRGDIGEVGEARAVVDEAEFAGCKVDAVGAAHSQGE